MFEGRTKKAEEGERERRDGDLRRTGSPVAVALAANSNCCLTSGRERERENPVRKLACNVSNDSKRSDEFCGFQKNFFLHLIRIR